MIFNRSYSKRKLY